ncbi:E3 ubiquitin-protein ligase Fancl isoform X2 [Musca autumnalis]|uniref:E3 ubiquitin-protein ligase Fancl isoform X2 n=1 Tax=Musca autumnalis TaxID=221902 RepID=UPI003CE7007D
MELEDYPELEELLLKHIGLVCHNQDGKKSCVYIEGPLKTKNSWMNIKIKCPNYPSLVGVKMQIQKNCNVQIVTHTDSKINCNWTIGELIENIPVLFEKQEYCNKESDPSQVKHQNIYAEIAALYLPSEYDLQTNELCSRVRFCNFSQNEQHYLDVALPSLQLLDHSLPKCIDVPELLGKATSLTALLQQYRKILEDLMPFYENFTEIDELCHVVQPSLPTTKENWRLFVLKERIFIKLQFSDPFTPLTSMSVHIIGPTTEVTQLRRVYSEGLRDWDSELDVHKNLLRIFDLCFFPMPPNDEAEMDDQGYCNICYSYKLDSGEIPIVSCDNAQCNLIFHAVCLKEWFSTLADGKTFLEVAFGACPFCKSKLSTSFQELLQQ